MAEEPALPAVTLPAVTVTAERIGPPRQENLWIRKVSLLLLPPELNQGDADAQLQTSQQGLDLSGGPVRRASGDDDARLRVVFNVQSGDTYSPNNAFIRVYNLAPSTIARINTREFSRVVLQAGYEQGVYGVIFKGDVTRYGIGKENAVDSYLDIFAMDGDFSNFATVNKTFAAGFTARDVIKETARAMRTPISHVPDFTGFNAQYARGKVMFGMARDLMTKVAATAGCTWSIQNGQVQILPLTGYLPGDAVVLNSMSGMIGIPEQTDQGVVVRALINPRVRIGGLIQINEADIRRSISQSNKLGALPDGYFFSHNRFAVESAVTVPQGDGLYRVYVAEYRGDTRGNDWYMDMVCLAVDRSAKQVTARN